MRNPWRRRRDEDFSDEVRAHLELETARLVEDGMSRRTRAPRRARRSATSCRAEERFHESNRWVWLEQFANDLRYAARGLRQSPAFLATTVLTLAVGLSLLTVVFTIFNAYVLRPFAVRDPAKPLSHRAGARPMLAARAFAGATTKSSASARDLFDAVIGEDTRFVSSEARSLAAAFVSDNYFEALGRRDAARPRPEARGRARAGRRARPPGVVRLFAADPAVARA